MNIVIYHILVQLQGITSIEAINDTQLLKRIIADIESKVPVFDSSELVLIISALSKLRTLLSATAIDLKVENTNDEEALLSDVKQKVIHITTKCSVFKCTPVLYHFSHKSVFCFFLGC